MWRRRRFLISPYSHQQPPRHSSSSFSGSVVSKRYESFDYCVDLVRRKDRENYLCTLLLPRESRLAAFAVRAFNVELANVRDMVSNPSTALMRFKFWSSVLDNIYASNRASDNANDADAGQISSVPEHPVAQALAAAVNEKKLSRKWLSELIDSRIDRQDERRTFQTIKELEDFYQRLVGSVFFLMLECTDVRQVHTDHAASHLGKALGLINGLRSINANPDRNVHLLPLELLLHHRVSQHDVVRVAAVKRRGRTMGTDGEDTQKRLRDLTYDMASQAHVHLEHCRKTMASSGRDNKKNKGNNGNNELAKLVLLPSAIVDHYLQILRKVDFDLFHPKFGSPYGWLTLTLWWRKVTKAC